jgi:Sortilin, neurotensin receptor 3,
MVRSMLFILLSACTSGNGRWLAEPTPSREVAVASIAESDGAPAEEVDPMVSQTLPSEDDGAAPVPGLEEPPLPPVVVRPPLTPSCSALPVGWTDVTPEDIDAGFGRGKFTGAAAVDPFRAGTVWVAGAGSHIFRSEDCGVTWAQVSTGKNSAAFLAQHAEVPYVGREILVQLVPDPQEEGVLFGVSYFDPTNVWKSKDRGETWDPLVAPDSPLGAVVSHNWYQTLSMDPTDHRHLLINTHDVCAAPYDDGCLGESFDGGETWTPIRNPHGVGWQENGGAMLFGHHSMVSSWPFGSFELSTNRGQSWTRPVGEGLGAGGAPTARAPDGYFYVPTFFSKMHRTKDGVSFETIDGPGGRTVGLVVVGDSLIASDQWTPTFRKATLSKPDTWEEMPAPAGVGSNEGCTYLAYDGGNRVLYASCWGAGFYRLTL